MVDNMNPNSQFHPYQPMSETPAIERQQGGLGSILDKLGGLGGIRNFNMNDSLGKVREYARANPSVVLGGLAALAIGAGLLRKRA
jgi:hypothetical protein